MTRTRNGLSRLTAAILVALALVAASCGDDEAAPDTSAADAAALEQAQAEAAAAEADAAAAAAEADAAAAEADAAAAKAAEAEAALEAAMADAEGAPDPEAMAELEAQLEAAQAEAAAAQAEADEAAAAAAAAAEAAAAAAAEDEMTFDPEGVLVVGQNFFPNQQASLDPRIMSTSTNAEFLNEIYATLATRDAATGEYSPYLAESYEVVDSQTLTVTIRADANFHDGRPVTAQDAKASIEATQANTAERTCNCNRGIALVESVEVVDDKTFTVNMAQPGLATLFELLIGPEFMISPADAGASQATNPIGNGPFRFVELVEGQRITLEKWDDFFAADDVMLGGLEFVNLQEGTTQLNALLAGDIDVAMELDFPSFEATEERDGFSGSAVQSGHHLHLVRGLPGTRGLLRGHPGAPGLHARHRPQPHQPGPVRAARACRLSGSTRPGTPTTTRPSRTCTPTTSTGPASSSRRPAWSARPWASGRHRRSPSPSTWCC